MTLSIQEPNLLPKDLSIVFCWQDHLDPRLHRFLIRDALNAAIGRLQSGLPTGADCILRQDSDTLNRGGSVDIANVILKKIRASTIVIGDITPVMTNPVESRFYPNPNVMIELGYAAKTLGWNRIICLFNKASGIRIEDFPFDVRHRRITSYNCRNRSEEGQASKDLQGILYSAIRAVLQEIGRGESDPSLGNENIKRQRDLVLLRQLMMTINRGALDYYIKCGFIHQLYHDCIYFWYGFDPIVSSSNFLLYDKELETRVINFHSFWQLTINYGSNLFYPSSNGRFSLVQSYNTDDLNAMISAYGNLQTSLRALLEYVHKNYIEIDMNKTDEIAWNDNLPYINGSFDSK